MLLLFPSNEGWSGAGAPDEGTAYWQPPEGPEHRIHDGRQADQHGHHQACRPADGAALAQPGEQVTLLEPAHGTGGASGQTLELMMILRWRRRKVRVKKDGWRTRRHKLNISRSVMK